MRKYIVLCIFFSLNVCGAASSSGTEEVGGLPVVMCGRAKTERASAEYPYTWFLDTSDETSRIVALFQSNEPRVVPFLRERFLPIFKKTFFEASSKSSTNMYRLSSNLEKAFNGVLKTEYDMPRQMHAEVVNMSKVTCAIVHLLAKEYGILTKQEIQGTIFGDTRTNGDYNSYFKYGGGTHMVILHSDANEGDVRTVSGLLQVDQTIDYAAQVVLDRIKLGGHAMRQAVPCSDEGSVIIPIDDDIEAQKEVVPEDQVAVLQFSLSKPFSDDLPV